jgi:DNA-binding transcriptional LysR family regulator
MSDDDLDWDLLRVFLAVMRTRTLRQAGARLGVSHPTIRRRLDPLEASLGLTLFERDAAWQADYPFEGRPTVASMPNMLLQRAACAEGLGLATLPCFLAEPELERRTEPRPSTDIWLLVHPDLRRAPRFRIVRDEVVAELDRLRPRLEGKTDAG